jgi:hypothetical protein
MKPGAAPLWKQLLILILGHPIMTAMWRLSSRGRVGLMEQARVLLYGLDSIGNLDSIDRNVRDRNRNGSLRVADLACRTVSPGDLTACSTGVLARIQMPLVARRTIHCGNFEAGTTSETD